MWRKTEEGHVFWQKNLQRKLFCILHLYPQKDKLDKLIEWMEEMFDASKTNNDDFLYLKGIEDCINKAKEIKDK